MAKPLDWKAVDTLISEQKYEQAAAAVAEIREAARAADNTEQWTKALVKETQLRLALHGYETAVRFFREQPWPDDARSRAILNLYYANGLMTYLEAYDWEIRQREKVESKEEIDLKAWTEEEIFREAVRAFGEVWAQREALGREPVSTLAEYLVPNTYPPEIRGTLRDAVSYLFAELLANTGHWRPEQSNELYALDLAALIRGNRSDATPDLTDMGIHPLLKVGTILADLETWHIESDRPEAALEARLERLRLLWASFTQADDRAAIMDDLKTRLPRLRGLPWWAEGMAQLSEFVRQGDSPNGLVEARAIAEEGHRAYPSSIGGQHCLSIVKEIERPDYSLMSMSTDGPRKRSVQITHKNLSKLYFRAYRLDLEEWIRNSTDYNLLPSGEEVKKLVHNQSPYLELQQWEMDLPETPDYRFHRTYSTPTLDIPGFYIIAASARVDFSTADNRLYSIPFIVSDLVLVSRQDEGGALEGRVVSGATGAPLAKAKVSLWARNWRQGHRSVASGLTDQSGLVRFDRPRDQDSRNFFLIVQRGEETSLDQSNIWFHDAPQQTETTASLLYTDRSVYRPMQKVFWKVLVYRGRHDVGRFTVSPATVTAVSLIDPNSQTVETVTVTTNQFGT
ncbi:MAG: hypothetical protein MUE60_15990, partial [Candidatus Eisenbacteria bacterium]|nr:hypothetical protein [Candidatus Eisenbacteria bacterium]